MVRNRLRSFADTLAKAPQTGRMKPLMMTCPSGISTRSTSLKIMCGFSANSNACGRMIRSIDSDAKGNRSISWMSESFAAPSVAFEEGGSRKELVADPPVFDPAVF